MNRVHPGIVPCLFHNHIGGHKAHRAREIAILSSKRGLSIVDYELYQATGLLPTTFRRRKDAKMQIRAVVDQHYADEARLSQDIFPGKQPCQGRYFDSEGSPARHYLY